MSLLNTLIKITDKASKRLGRGYGSGKGGHTSSRGQKGHRARQGKPMPLWFEGGQLPLIKRMPMIRGKARFNVLHPTAEITLSDLNKFDTDTISMETLKLHKLIDPRFKKAKIINKGTLEKKVQVKGLRVTAGAKAAIEKLGGSIE